MLVRGLARSCNVGTSSALILFHLIFRAVALVMDAIIRGDDGYLDSVILLSNYRNLAPCWEAVMRHKSISQSLLLPNRRIFTVMSRLRGAWVLAGGWRAQPSSLRGFGQSHIPAAHSTLENHELASGSARWASRSNPHCKSGWNVRQLRLHANLRQHVKTAGRNPSDRHCPRPPCLRVRSAA